ncbi:MAG: hypothetical protein PWQ45_141 [Thermosipho sp. (in: thermotogales)]|nr:hypothetical protein [Thermosipho sp. (in: thermotogales)]
MATKKEDIKIIDAKTNNTKTEAKKETKSQKDLDMEAAAKRWKNLDEKIFYFQQKMAVPKKQWNEHNKYNYRSLSDILEALKPLLKETFVVLEFSEEIEIIGERYYMTSTALFRDLITNEEMAIKARAREADHQPGMSDTQLTGSCSTYARKYALGNILLLSDNLDEGDGIDPDYFDNKDTVKINEKTKQEEKKKQTKAAFNTHIKQLQNYIKLLSQKYNYKEEQTIKKLEKVYNLDIKSALEDEKLAENVIKEIQKGDK